MDVNLENLSDYGENDKDKLTNFLEQTYNFVAFLYQNPTDFIPRDAKINILEERELILNAWNEFDESYELKAEQEKIISASKETLVNHGLFGGQLKLKLTIIEKFFQLWTSNQDLGKYLKRLIDAIDNLLDSMIEALGINGALKEMKDAYSTILG